LTNLAEKSRVVLANQRVPECVSVVDADRGSAMYNIQGNPAEYSTTTPIFQWQLRLRTMFGLVSVVCGLLAVQRIWGEWPITAFVASIGLSIWALWLATSREPRQLGLLLLMHLAIGVLLLLGPIAAYHLTGRAWYDYGLLQGDPVTVQDSDGITRYYPLWTLSQSWPRAGPILETLTRVCIFAFVPPTAWIIAILAPFMIVRLRTVLSPRQKWRVAMLWLIGVLPIAYLLAWGMKVAKWLGPLTG
jgi:hypothetical protein